MAVELTTTDGKKAAGTVSALGADAASSTTTATGSDGDSEGSAGTTSGDTGSESAGTSATGSSAPVQLRISVPDSGELADEAEAAVKVTIKIGASDGKVLVVPLAAIRTSSDGKVRVQVERGGRLSDVHVAVGLSAAGLVEVKPTSGTLAQGDKVVVGE